MENSFAAEEEMPAPPPKPSSYKDILQMLEQGKTPPGIRVCLHLNAPLYSGGQEHSRLHLNQRPVG